MSKGLRFFQNQLDQICNQIAKRGEKKILLAWNRGLGDIALGLYAIIHRIRLLVPEAEITFLIRKNLQEGFEFLPGVQTLVAPDWQRDKPYDVKETLHQLGYQSQAFDLIIPWPDPTKWVQWQRGRLTPKLYWNPIYNSLWKKYNFPEELTYIGVHAVAETEYGLWRNWPIEKWNKFFEKIKRRSKTRIILFGNKAIPAFEGDHIIDLRGQTTLFEMLSIIQNCCHYLIAPDSGVLSIVYYLDTSFPLRVISLWADPNHGILKQRVLSPNSLLIHRALIATYRDLSSISVDDLLDTISEK